MYTEITPSTVQISPTKMKRKIIKISGPSTRNFSINKRLIIVKLIIIAKIIKWLFLRNSMGDLFLKYKAFTSVRYTGYIIVISTAKTTVNNSKLLKKNVGKNNRNIIGIRRKFNEYLFSIILFIKFVINVVFFSLFYSTFCPEYA